MMNFNDMPDEIKTLIFGFNRAKQVEIEKVKFKMVMDDLRDMTELTYTDYYDEDEEDNIIDYEWGFANALIQAVNEINMDNRFHIYQEKQLDNYLDGCG